MASASPRAHLEPLESNRSLRRTGSLHEQRLKWHSRAGSLKAADVDCSRQHPRADTPTSGSGSPSCASACSWRSSTSRSWPPRCRRSRRRSASPPDQMSWVQTAYLIAEVIAIPLTGFLTRGSAMRWLFVIGVSVFTLASLGCAAQRRLRPADRLARDPGLLGRHPDPGGLLGRLPAVPASAGRASRRRSPASLAVLAPTVGPIVGGWITETYSWHWLFLINLAPGIVWPPSVRRLLLPRERAEPGLAATPRPASPRPDGARAGRAGDRAEGGAARGWALAAGPRPAGPERCVRRRLRPAHAWRPETPVVDLRTFADRNFAIGCAAQLRSGDRPVRLGLSDAGLPGLRARPRPLAIGDDHAGHRRWPSC